MTSKTPASENKSDRAVFGASLRRRREERELSLENIATTTRIPLRSLEALEDGAFSDLPADVFVRGFLRSYAKCVGLEPADILEQYAALGFDAAPVASEMASEVLEQLKEIEEGKASPARTSGPRTDNDKPRRRMARGTGDWLSRVKERRAERAEARAEERKTQIEAKVSKAEPASSHGTDESSEPSGREPKPRMFLPRDFSAQDDADGRRGNLTFAVLILVIVATIAMSYLMRRPSHAGDGISEVSDVERPELA